MLMTTRERLVAYRTQLINKRSAVTPPSSASRPPKGLPTSNRCWRGLPKTQGCPSLPKELFAMHGQELDRLKDRAAPDRGEAEGLATGKNEMSRRLAEVDAIGPIGGCLLAIKAPDPKALPLRPRLRGLDGAVTQKDSFHRGQRCGSG